MWHFKSLKYYINRTIETNTANNYLLMYTDEHARKSMSFPWVSLNALYFGCELAYSFLLTYFVIFLSAVVNFYDINSNNHHDIQCR